MEFAALSRGAATFVSLRQQAPVPLGHFGKHRSPNTETVFAPRFDPENLFLETPDEARADLLKAGLIFVHGLRQINNDSANSRRAISIALFDTNCANWRKFIIPLFAPRAEVKRRRTKRGEAQVSALEFA